VNNGSEKGREKMKKEEKNVKGKEK